MARTAAARDALETLVQQFSQPFAFLRELIQNALDAGTNRVDVAVGPQGDSLLVEVADTGEGMTREIIDTQLTRLFSSSKESDFTKIGKFGIGFVSVFAIQPQAVVVDTGREGESWRVLFRPDRSFERIVRADPIEGTRVAVYVPAGPHKAGRFVQECRDTVSYWCKHCDVEIRFNGEPIQQPFDLDSPYQVRHLEQGTEVVAAPSLESQPLYGFYNRGLTLLEGRGSPLTGVSFKVRSRYLEHTLTRDNVIQDQNYDKVMDLVRRTAYGRIPERLFEALSSAEDPVAWGLARLAAAYPGFKKTRAWSMPVIPGLSGRRHSLRELEKGPKAVAAEADDDLARAAEAEGVPVVAASRGALELLADLCLGARPLQERYYLAQLVDASEEESPLLRETARLLKAAGLERLRLSSLALSGAPFRGRLAVFCHDFGRAQHASRADRYTRGHFLALNHEHPLWKDLVAVARHDPGLSAYVLARAVCLDCGVDPREDSGMLAAALRRRRKLAAAPLPALVRSKRPR